MNPFKEDFSVSTYASSLYNIKCQGHQTLSNNTYVFAAGLEAKNCQSPETPGENKMITAQVASPSQTPRETKSRISSRRKSVASVCFKDNIGDLKKGRNEEARNSLLEIPSKDEKGKRKTSQRRKSMAAVSMSQSNDEGGITRRISTRRRSVLIPPVESESLTAQHAKKTLEKKIEMFLESDRNESKESAKKDDAEKSCGDCSNKAESDTTCDNLSKEMNLNLDNVSCNQGTESDKTVTKIKNRRQSSQGVSENLNNSKSPSFKTNAQSVKNQNTSKETGVKILKPKKKLLAASDMEANSFLIQPTMCSEKVFNKLLDNTPGSTSTQITKKDKKFPGQKRKNQSVDVEESSNTPKKCRRDEEKSPCSVTLGSISRESLSENRTGAQNLSKDSDMSRDVSESENTLGSSMSAVFSESTCSNMLFTMSRPRQSIDEFNLRTKFNNKKMRRKKKILSDSAVSSLNTESDSSSTCEEDKKVRKMKRNPSFTKTSPQRPSLVMTSLHSQ